MPISRLLGNLGFAALVFTMLGSTTAASHAAPHPVIALFTDYGWDDPYVAQLKGVIVTIDPNARLLDLTHTVTPFNVTEGAYLLDQSAEEFPAGTIFVAVIDPQVGTERDPVLVETAQEKYYVGPDNGLFTNVIDREGFSKAWKLDKPEYFRPGTISHSFHGRDIFGPIAAHLAAGMSPDRLGTAITSKSLTVLPIKDATFAAGNISVEVMHVDRYGNVVLNLDAKSEAAAKLKEGNLVKISIGKEIYSAPLVKTYGDVGKGRMILLYGGSGLLEIAVNQGSAAKQLKVEPGAVIFLKP
jgi:S-adenosyl-L-methionine hydrolase (adenosine-forming)